MHHKHTTVADAYGVLGLQQGATLDVVKSTYRQLALKTHPDKNPGSEDATAQFQRLSEAYNVLVKHLDRSARPPPPRGPYGYSPFAGHANDDDEYDDYEDYYDDEYDSDEDYEEDLDFYMFLFEEMMRGRANRYANMRYQRTKPPPETESEEHYQARLQRIREEQAAAEARRAREEAERKAALELEREKEKKEAEVRQREKASKKKAVAEENRKAAAQAARNALERVQRARSAVFTAARAGDAAKVRKGVWEDGVDAAGGEVRKGCEEFVPSLPKDPKETLLHIVARIGDAELVEWLDNHSAEAEERDSHGLTAFHAALQHGHIPVIKYFFETYAPKDSDSEGVYTPPPSKSTLHLALDSGEPEVVWTVLDKGLASERDIREAWTWANSVEGRTALSGRDRAPKVAKAGQGTVEEIMNILMSFGGFTPPPTPKISPQKTSSGSGNTKPPRNILPSISTSGFEERRGASADDGSPEPTEQTPTPKASPPPSDRPQYPARGRGRGRGRGGAFHNSNYQSHTPPSPMSPVNGNARPFVDDRTASPHSPQDAYAYGHPAQSHSQGGDRGGYRGRGYAPGRGRGRGGYAYAYAS